MYAIGAVQSASPRTPPIAYMNTCEVSVCQLISSGLLFCPEGRGRVNLRNVGIILPNYTALHQMQPIHIIIIIIIINGVHSASSVQLRSYLKGKVASLV
jgi:hypothetical protein